MKSRTLLCALSLGFAWSYFLSVFLLEKSFFGISFRLAYFFPTVIASVALIYSGIHRTVNKQLVSWNRLTDATTMVLVSLLSLLACDIGYGLYLNRLNPRQSLQHALASTSRYTVGELYPRLYYPTEKSFYIHKPRFSASGEHYGELYSLDLMKSQTLAKSVFELHPVSISIDESGFRETTPLAAARIFALGDSFTLGWGVKQNETWVEQLEKALRRPIYNLGVSGLSPKQELLLLEYMLKQGKEAPQISHLLWMIYEGNDLEDHYEPMRVAEKHAIRDYLAGTVLEHLLMIPLMARDEAIITKLLNGQVRLKSLAGSSTALHDEVDGVTLPHPLFRSSIHGNRLFHSLYLRRASETRSYVMDHPNRAALEQVFKDMASLAKRYHFDVTVVIAPTDSRLYASHFEDFPSISEQPYFINLVADMSHKMGFQTINLLPLLQSYARAELLYFRDDDHWNVRGNQVVAEILARHFHTNDVRP